MGDPKIIANNLQVWNSIAETHESTIPLNFHPSIDFLPRTSSILEVGCGYGRILKHLYQLGFKNVIGVDGASSMLERCIGTGQKNVMLGDATDLPFPSNSFDLVIATEVIEHLPKNEGYKAINGIERVSSDRIILSVPNGPRPQSESYGNKYEAHQSSWWKRDLENLGYHVLLVIGPELHKSLALVESIRRLIFRINYMGILVALKSV